MAEILIYNGKTVIRGGSDAFEVFKGIQTGKIKLPKIQEVQTSQKTKAPKKSKMTATIVVPAKPRPEPPKQQKVVKRSETVDIKPGDWFKELQSLTTEKKEKKEDN